MSRTSHVPKLGWILFCWLALVPAIEAVICVQQSATVRYFQGVVFDEVDGRPATALPGAWIEVARGDMVRKVVSDEEGFFSIPNLPPGNYKVRVGLEGWSTTYGDVRIRSDIASDRALLLGISIDIDSCGLVDDTSWAELREIQGARQNSGTESSYQPTPARCDLELVDDRGVPIEAPVSVCLDGASGFEASGTCLSWPFEGRDQGYDGRIVVDRYRFGGPSHGPRTTRLEADDQGFCRVEVARKAEVLVSFDASEVSRLEASLYDPVADPDLLQPPTRFDAENAESRQVAAGVYVLSLAERGWAPDLHLLDLPPGSRHEVTYRRRDGWSTVLRAVAAAEETPVSGVALEIWTIPGFDLAEEAGASIASPDPELRRLQPLRLQPRRLRALQTGPQGLAVVSGLRVPLAGASTHHPDFLDGQVPAFSSEVGTFRVFEARLFRGGALEIQVNRRLASLGTVPARGARCELFRAEDPEQKTTLGPGDVLYGTEADRAGSCRLSGIPAGPYALRVSLPDERGAGVFESVHVQDEETLRRTFELRPIRISGRLTQGDEGAPGYTIRFFHVERLGETPMYPGGRATTDEDGDYELAVWTPGRYLGEVLTDSAMTGVFRRVEIYDDETVDFEIAAAEVHGRVVDSNGDPRPDASVSIRHQGLTRGVVLDDDARFEITFRDELPGVATLAASEPGYLESEPLEISIDPARELPPVTLVLEPRTWRSGRLLLPSGRPAVGAWLTVHRTADPLRYPFPFERRTTDSQGRFELPEDDGGVRIFYGGPGCALGFFDLRAASTRRQAAAPQDLEVVCSQPAHLMIRLRTEDPQLRAQAPFHLRRGDVTVPAGVLERHLASLGLPGRTDGQGFLGLVALEPGTYDVFHGLATSAINVALHQDEGRLATVVLGENSTVEVEATVEPLRD